MKIKDLIACLSQMPASAVVQAWDPDSEEYEDVTGVVWDPQGQWLFIQTDGDDGDPRTPEYGVGFEPG